MQQMKSFNLFFQLFRNWPNRVRTNLLFNQENVRSVRWDSLEGQRREFVEHIRKLLPVSYEQGEKIFDEVPALRSKNQMILMKPNIDLLLKKHFQVESIIENPFVLLMKREIIEHKLEILESMSPKDVNDFLPLLEMKLPELKRIAQHAQVEKDIVPEGNRIYLFSRDLKVDAHIVAKYFVKHAFIFTAVLSGVQKKLRILQDYNVASLNILQSLYVFQCSDQLLIRRLEKFHSIGMVDIRLWTIKCTEENFEEYFKSIWIFSSGATNGMPYRSLRQIDKEKTMPSSPEPADNAANDEPTIHTEKSKVLTELQDMLPCDDEEAATIYYNQINYFDQLSSAKMNISFLLENQIDNRSILDNPFLLTMDVDEIKDKLDVIKEMQPRKVTDFVPLLKLDLNKLVRIRDNWKGETSFIEQKHRVYYFSEKLQISPSIVSEAFAKNERIFFWAFDLLAPKLDTLLSYNITGSEILSCLDVFARGADTISKKLKLLSANENEQISPWMLCCEEDRFDRLVEKRMEKKAILDECEDVEEYLIKRLNWSEEQTQKFRVAYPVLFKSSVLKLREYIDYLLNETRYTIDDINGHIFIFRRNLHEIKCRINEFNSLNYSPKLYLLASDRNTYLKKIKKLCKNTEHGMAKYSLIERRLRDEKSMGKY